LLTKADVISKIKTLNKSLYINNTVSCSVAIKKEGNFTHCGTCSQCVDRRFAMHSSDLNEDDGVGIYTKNFITEKIINGDRTTIIDHVRQALYFKEMSSDIFFHDMSVELGNLLDYIDLNEEAAFNELYKLCKRHGQQVHQAIIKMREVYDDPFKPVTKGSFLDLIREKEYLKPDVKRLCERISKKLEEALPIIFKNNGPKNENDLNDKINGIINGEAPEYGREFPYIQFASIRTVPDHSFNSHNLLIESKYLRGTTNERVITDGISSDIIKYSENSHILFLVYDPQHKIANDNLFKNTYENKSNNITVHILR
jgi:hypothetical protein